jgi:hypothetical protein
LFAVEVVTDVPVIKPASGRGAGALDEEQHGNGGTASRIENLAPLLAALLAGGALVPAQVVDVDLVELTGEGLAESVCGVAVDVPAVGDIADHSPVFGVQNPVGGPADGADVGIVERVLVRRRGPFHIGGSDGLVQGGVFEVCVVVVAAGLADGVGRVADDDPDIERVLLDHAVAVVGEDVLVEGVAVFSHLERIGEHDPVE